MPTKELLFEMLLKDVPLKALDALIGLAKDLGCKVATLQPGLSEWEGNEDEGATRELVAVYEKPHDPARTSELAKNAIIERLKIATAPVPRRELIKALRAKHFKKNSVGPLCTELKKEGKIVNPRRGEWILSSGHFVPRPRAEKVDKDVNRGPPLAPSDPA